MVLKKKLTAAEKQRRYREKRKADPERDTDYKEKHKLRNAKRKNINEMTEREKRSQRKYWRKLDSKRRQKKLVNEQLPPTPPEDDTSLNNRPSGNTTRGRKVILKNRSKCVRENKKLKSELLEMEKKLKNAKMRTEKYRKRLSRMTKKVNQNFNLTPENELTPISKAKKCLGSPFNKLSRKDAKKSKVVRTLVFHESLVKSLKSGYESLKKRQHKRVLSSMLMSKYIRDYRLQGLVSRAIGLAGRKRLVETVHKKESKVKFEIETFFLCDDVSKTTAGMKETITRKKIKMQKRYLVNSMKRLYQHFLKSRVIDQLAISYKTFTRYRPFYVCKPTEVNRDTCLCKYHANITFKTKKLKQLKLVESEDPHDLYKNITCDKRNVSCMYGTCKECKFKTVPIIVPNENEQVTWQQWDDVVVTKEKIIKGVKKQYQVKIAMKENVTKPVKTLVEEFQRDLALFKKHVLNIKNQNDAYKSLKENLSDKQAILHVDFSENYACKLAEEIQTFHFGASREQATLHTGVLIVNKNVKPIPFSTISDSRVHNPAAIWAHLRPILCFLLQNYPTVETVHFFSDGPSTQYRQKKNFYLFSKLLFEFGFKSGSWNYFEASHGKGAPDGVGGALKRMANAQVAHGVDIPDAKSLFSLLKEDSSVKLFFVSQSEIDELQYTIPETLKAIPGTRSIHQVVTNSNSHIKYRPLSCFCSKNDWLKGDMCNCHIPFKFYSYACLESENIVVPETMASTPKPKATNLRKKKQIYKQVYSSSDEDSEPEVEYMESDVDEFGVNDMISSTDPNHDTDFPILETPSSTNVRKGVHVLVKLLGGARKKTNYQYVAVCRTDIEKDGEIKVMFLNVVGENASLFKTNDNDISYIDFNQIVGVLPNPNIKLKGNRVFYKFPASINVFEQG